MVFFCGAGVSRPAGLPDFDGLARDLLQRLGAEQAKRAYDRQETLDRVFSALVKEFGGGGVDREISLALRAPRRAELRFHRVVLDLSRGSNGVPQIVTTNFDLLFERVGGKLRYFVPPALPDLALLQPIQGIVYLHGRLRPPNALARAGYVISSADFGRAYLAEGWAARFVRELRERYTIVLLGYSANDPPMRYLLEGLNSRDGASYRSPIYTFAQGEAGVVEEEWQDKGVTAIPYDALDRQHSGLWSTLEVWAQAAKERNVWQRKLIALAQRRPSELRRFERGQVAHLIRTKAGAKAFADAKPSPPAEWLCVFDSSVRYAKPGKNLFENDGVEVDPLDLFGLDSDPPRPPSKPNGAVEVPGEDLLRWRYGDETWPERQRLAGWHSEWSNQLPPRLFHIARWFGDVLDDPAAVWWAAGNGTLHPVFLSEVKRGLDRHGSMHEVPKHFWLSYIEGQRQLPDVLHDGRWYDFSHRLKDTGWTGGALRDFERLIQPYFEFSRPRLRRPTPPIGAWGDLPLLRVAEISIKVVGWDSSAVNITPEVLLTVVVIVRRSLERMSQMLEDSTVMYWKTPTLHPTEGRDEQIYGRKAGYFLKFKSLFMDLLKYSSMHAKQEFLQWREDDPFFFGKLVIFGMMHPELCSGSEAAARLLALPSRIFWDPYNQRELLFTLRARWSDLSTTNCRRLERRIIKGPERFDNERVRDFRRRKAATSASLLRWLELNGCTLSSAASALMPKLKAADDRWNDAWALSADDSLESHGGVVERITETQGLERVQISKVIDLAKELSSDSIRELRNFRPFEGLVKGEPLKALAALRYQAKRGIFPTRFWENLLSEWPGEMKPRLTWLLAFQLIRLPQKLVIELRHYIPRWLGQHLPILARINQHDALRVFDAIVAKFRIAEPSVLESGIGHATVGGVVQERSNVSFGKAINSPGGSFAETLLQTLGQPQRRGPLLKAIRSRLEALLTLPGDGGGHAACIVAQRLSWIEYWDQKWVRQVFVPRFDLSQPLSEALWHGLACDRRLLTPATQRILNPHFLALLSGEGPWQLDDSERREMFRRLVWFCRANSKGDVPTITFAEARDVLRKCDDLGRSNALSALAVVLGEGGSWSGFVKPFILRAWPRQIRLRSEATAREFARIAVMSGDNFPEAVDVVLPFLRPVAHFSELSRRMQKEASEGYDYAQRFPDSTLVLLSALVGDDRQTIPWELGFLLENLVESKPTLRQNDTWIRLKKLAG